MLKVGLYMASPQATHEFAVLHGLETRCCSLSGGINSQEKRESATEYRLSVYALSGNLKPSRLHFPGQTGPTHYSAQLGARNIN